MKKITIFLLSMFFAVNFFAVSVFTVRVFASDELGEVDIHGFISQGYLKSDDHKFYSADTDDGTFEFNEMGINFATDLTDDLRLGMQLLSRDLGSLGNDEVVIDWAYADYRYRNWLGLQVGKVKKPGGLYNQSRDVDAARTCLFLPSGIYNDAYREAQLANKGFGIYGTLPGHVDYQIVYGVFDVSKEGAVAQRAARSLGGIEASSTDVDRGFSGQVLWNTPLDGLRIGASAANYEFTLNFEDIVIGADLTTVPPTLFTSDIEIVAEGDILLGSIEYVYGDFVFTSEYRLLESEITTTTIYGPTLSDSDQEDYYVMVTYRFTDWFELGVYYSAHYDNKDDRDGKDRKQDYDDWAAAIAGGFIPATTPQPPRSLQFKEEAYLKDFAISLRFDINDYWIFKLEGHFMDGLADLDFSESDDPTDPDSDWTLFAAKVSYSF